MDLSWEPGDPNGPSESSTRSGAVPGGEPFPGPDGAKPYPVPAAEPRRVGKGMLWASALVGAALIIAPFPLAWLGVFDVFGPATLGRGGSPGAGVPLAQESSAATTASLTSTPASPTTLASPTTPSRAASPTTSPSPTSMSPTVTARALSTQVTVREAEASGYTEIYYPGNAIDGNVYSYWESTTNAFPQSLALDLGTPATIGRIVIDLPPVADWNSRTQTLAIRGSTGTGSYFTIVDFRDYTFDVRTGNAVTIGFPPATSRYLRLEFSGNAGWPAAQVSELHVYTP